MLARITIFVVSTLFLPLVGAALAGTSLSFRFEYPPVPRHSLVPDFSAAVFGVYTLLLLIATGLVIGSVCRGERAAAREGPAGPATGYTPWWTWAGLAAFSAGVPVGLIFHPAPAIFLLLTGLALAVDGLNCRRGATLVGQRPGYFLTLFAVGALLWWLLEYLNRFGEIWHFAFRDRSTTWQYAALTTMAFAPVPAAVMALQVWINGLSIMAPLRRGRPLPAASAQTAALWLTLLAVIGLMAGGLWPPLIGLMWTAPVLLLSALQLLWNRETFFSGIFRGSWSRFAASVAAGIITGTVFAAANTLFDGTWRIAPPLLNCCHLLGVPAFGYVGFGVLGLLSMQLNDRLAGIFPGRAKRAPQKRKPFPIPVRSE